MFNCKQGMAAVVFALTSFVGTEATAGSFILYDEADKDCLAKNIYFEGRGETLRGKLAIAWTTVNRVRDPRFPSNICDVVLQPKQFSWTHDGRSDNVDWEDPIEVKAWREIVRFAETFLQNMDSMKDPSFGATHYHTTSVDPYWADEVTLTTKVGEHVFYRWP